MADKANIAVDTEVVAIDSIELHAHNPRKGDVPAIMLSLENFGQQKPIVVDANNVVVAGNHTLLAARKLGWKTIAITRGGLEGDDALRYLLADNRASDRARYKNSELGDILQMGFDLEGTGYDVDDVEDVLAAAGAGEEDGPPVGPNARHKPAENGNAQPAPEAPKREPIREVVMMMPQTQAIEFGKQVAALQKFYKTNTVVDTVRQAVADRAADLESTVPTENPPFEPGDESVAAEKPKRRSRAKAA